MRGVRQVHITFLAGVLFAIGLGVSGMTRPDKVLNFLDFTGAWDPSLAGVMIGAILVYGVAFRRITARMQRPLLLDRFSLPTRTDIDARLVLGSILFGVGWGLLGLCPGPALTSLVTGDHALLLFIASMLVGMFGFNVILARAQQRRGS